MRKLVVLTLVGALAASALPSTALAGDPHAVRDRWAGAAIGAAAVVAGAAILHSLATPPAAVPTSGYHQPPVVYTPPPVVYTPPPVVYRPPVVVHPPVVVYRPPVVIHRHVPPPHYRYWDRHDRYDRYGRWGKQDRRWQNRHDDRYRRD